MSVTRKHNVELKQGRDVPIVSMSRQSNYQHMLNSNDIPRVEAIASFLYNQGFELYLGGSLTENWFFNGPNISRGHQREYNDIDILAKASKKSTIERAFEAVNVLGSTNAKDLGIVFGDRAAFKVEPQGPTEAYFNIYRLATNLGYRYTLTPLLTLEEAKTDPSFGWQNKLPVKIDLTLTVDDLFRKKFKLHMVKR